MNPLLLILAAAAVWYVPTLVGVLNLDIKIKNLIPTQILENSINFDLALLIKNNSIIRININSMDVDVLLNGEKIGTINQNYKASIQANRSEVIHSSLQITPDNLGDLVWTELINRNLQNAVLTLKGTIRANARPFPFESTFTIKDLTTGLGICRHRIY